MTGVMQTTTTNNNNNNSGVMVQTSNMSSMSELFELLDKLQSSRLGKGCMATLQAVFFVSLENFTFIRENIAKCRM